MILSTTDLMRERNVLNAKLLWMNVNSDKRNEYEARIREIDEVLKGMHHTAS